MKIYTNSLGVATADLSNGNYSYTALKDGYSLKSGTFSVNNAPVGVNFILSSIGTLIVPYQIPYVNNVSDYGNVVYFDPDFVGTPDGSELNPYNTHPNSVFSGGIPSNTAILLKRGTSYSKIGMTGTTRIPAMVYNSNMIGAYGTGARPIVDGLWIASNSTNLTIRDLDIQYQSKALTNTYDIIINLWAGDGARPSNITIAYNILSGVYNSGGSWTTSIGPRPYPHMAVRGGGDNITIYHNEIKDVGDNGLYLDAHTGYKIVRNFIYDINRRNWGRNMNDNVGGDCIQFAWRFPGAYVAGNWLEPGRNYYTAHPSGNDFWKHSYIPNCFPTGGWDSTDLGTITEYNTILSPPTNTYSSGPVIYYNPPQNSSFRYNLIAPPEGRTGRTNMAAGGGVVLNHLNQSEPYGIYGNHWIRRNPATTDPVTWEPDDQLVLAKGNLIFDTWTDFNSYGVNNPLMGSDINPDNFWQFYN